MTSYNRPTEVQGPRRRERLSSKSRARMWMHRAGGIAAFAATIGAGYAVVEYTNQGKTLRVVPDTNSPAHRAPQTARSPETPPATTSPLPTPAQAENRGASQDTQTTPQSNDPTNGADTVGELTPQPAQPTAPTNQFQPHD